MLNNLLVNSNMNESLINAAALGNIQKAQYALNNEADINYVDTTYGNPLHTAIANHRVDMVKFLIENGANVNIICPYKCILYKKLEEADFSSNAENISFSYEYKNPLQLIYDIYEKSPLEQDMSSLNNITDLLLKHNSNIGFDINASTDIVMRDRNGTKRLIMAYKDNTRLTRAIERSNLNFTKFLIKIGANPNLYTQREIRFTVLRQLILEKNKIEMIKILIEGGVDINFCDLCGTTPLMYLHEVRQRGMEQYNIAKLLLEAGADTNIENYQGIRFNINSLDISDEQKEDLRNTNPNRNLVIQNLSSRADLAIHLRTATSFKAIDCVSFHLPENADSHKTSIRNRLRKPIVKELNKLSDIPKIEEINNVIKLIENINIPSSSVTTSLHEASAVAIYTNIININ